MSPIPPAAGNGEGHEPSGQVSIKPAHMVNNPWAYTLKVVDHRRWKSESRALHTGGCPGQAAAGDQLVASAALDGAMRGFVFGVAARNLSQFA
jgi:hypothetical protein